MPLQALGVNVQLITWRNCLASIAAALLLALQAHAATESAAVDPAVLEKNRKANESCFSCHSEAGFKKPPRTDMDMKKLAATLYDPKVFAGSNHGTMDCRQCHGQSYNDYPHSDKGKSETSPCSECHANKVARLEPQYEASVHARLESVKAKFTCATCHDPHIDLGATLLKDPLKIVAQDNKACLECHDSDETFAKYAAEDEKTPGIKKKRPNVDAIHDWLPNTKQHWKAVRCVECHTPEVKENRPISHEILDKKKAEKKCVSCHSANSSLRTRLYRHLVKEEVAAMGFTNSVILSSSYVIGATRNPVLDLIVIGLVALTLAGVLLHGAIRIIFAIRRKGKTQ